jgi:drug/metabolite transporter (DMT)-like permease
MAIITTLIFWASAFAGIRVGLKAYSPENLVFFRFLTASLVLLVYAIIIRMPLPERKDLPAIFFLGFFCQSFNCLCSHLYCYPGYVYFKRKD